MSITAMPVMIAVLCVLAIAYRYYSAFLAARVATLDDLRATPAVRLADGQNYEPTNKWVLFGHHFAAISGAGPLIGPVLAAQFGYLPGLLWIVIGVCLAGAVQDFLVLAASLRREGKSLAQIAFFDIGPIAGTAATIAILFIVVIALAGLGKVVVNTLGGDAVAYPPASRLVLPAGATAPARSSAGMYQIPGGAHLLWGTDRDMGLSDGFVLKTPSALAWKPSGHGGALVADLPAKSARIVPGSSWGTFTIAATIPIALLIGFYMYRIRKGRILEASLIGAALTIGAVFLGGWVAVSRIGPWFNLTGQQVLIAMAIYGFVAAVLPVWVLLCPRDYLSSFLKIGTIILLVIGTLVANPRLEAPAINHVFLSGGPVVGGRIFPFLFITIMCGAISGFHALVSSGTTPKMIRRESDARAIGFGCMLIEGLVAVVAMIAASTLSVGDYYAMNTGLAEAPQYNQKILDIPGGGIEHVADYEALTQESLRGRTGGAVTLAVGMAHILTPGGNSPASAILRGLWKYWYHFAIMFEALFILTTIDAGTRIGRFLLQEVMGRFHPRLGQVDWIPGAILSTALMVLGWSYFINSDNFKTIWQMFGIANQMLAVIALAVVSVYLVNQGKTRYVWVTFLPMLLVMTTTGAAAMMQLQNQINGITTQLHLPPARRDGSLFKDCLQAALILAILLCTGIVIAAGAVRVWIATQGFRSQPRVEPAAA